MCKEIFHSFASPLLEAISSSLLLNGHPQDNWGLRPACTPVFWLKHIPDRGCPALRGMNGQANTFNIRSSICNATEARRLHCATVSNDRSAARERTPLVRGHPLQERKWTVSAAQERSWCVCCRETSRNLAYRPTGSPRRCIPAANRSTMSVNRLSMSMKSSITPVISSITNPCSADQNSSAAGNASSMPMP
jgi:hypothetical protein